MAQKKIEPKVGDIFHIPISEDYAGFGQILAKYENEMLLMAVFSIKCAKNEVCDLGDVVASQPLFIANSMDAKLYHGYWPVVGNAAPDYSRLPLPRYKVNIGNMTYLESYDAKRRRPAKEPELQIATFRKCVAPKILEDALQAHFGFFKADQFTSAQRERLEAEFESLKAIHALRSAQIPL